MLNGVGTDHRVGGGRGTPGGAGGDALGVEVNGQPLTVTAGATIADVVAARWPAPEGIAVARNREVVPRSIWSSTVLHAGDRLEIVTAAAGG